MRRLPDDLPHAADGSAPLYPLVEGMNMGVWIGFKHVNYLMEHGIARHLAGRGTGVRSLYWGADVRLLLCGSQVRYETALTYDEPVRVTVRASAHGAGGLELEVAAFSERLGSTVRIARGRYQALFLNRLGEVLEKRPPRVEALLAEDAS